MSHGHDHHSPAASGGRLMLVVALNLVITAVEVAGGLISGSLSLLSDALHNFSDGVAVLIAWFAMLLKRRPRSDRYTFGLRRAEVVAAVINAGVLVAISIYLFVEAWQRFAHPQPIRGGIMTTVAFVGLVANVLGTWLLHQGAQHNMNLRAAYLHLLSDAVSSVGVILGGLAILWFGIYWVDPLLTVLIGLYVLKESLQILWRALGVFLLAAPPGVSLDAVREALAQVPGIVGVHHLHLWQPSEEDIHFAAHIELEDQPLSSASAIRERAERMLHEQFGINHATLQIEPQASHCDTRDLA